MHNYHIYVYSIQWRILVSLYNRKFSQFHAVFWMIWQNRVSAAIVTENPGSAPGICQDFVKKKKVKPGNLGDCTQSIWLPWWSWSFSNHVLSKSKRDVTPQRENEKSPREFIKSTSAIPTAFKLSKAFSMAWRSSSPPSGNLLGK